METKRIILTKTVQGYDNEIEQVTNNFLASIKNLHPKVISVTMVNVSTGWRVMQTIVVEVDEK